ncbi:MAG: glutathionylspermidine synthase family protein [Gammaproteobacteria bacterium]|nr:glutathionylspermidine synthase family protein [Gammaproteobacteria bacterium]MBU1722449.1 glutathionylspermidine synthase family protein [Gammaproteobacteria bacterium]MBU2004948.1 glutathionylspermidine synthase family protein [Gammaproteobacteria bacterium]
MIKLEKVNPLSPALMEEVGMTWHTDPDGQPYVADEIVQVTQAETEAYYAAANELYDMYVEAAQYVIDNDLFLELDIPYNLVDQINRSWENDHRHLYGRFDFAGGVDGLPIKLIEFNADTPTSLFETAVVQWALLKANGMDEAAQFNTVYASIRDNFRRLVTGEEDPEAFGEYYRFQNMLFSSIRDLPEDERTVRFLQHLATDAGFQTDFCYMDEVGFLESDGIFNPAETRFDYWFKLYPWEDIALQTDGINGILDDITRNTDSVILNPAYTLLFQSKGIMKVLYDLFPDSPYLLETRYEPLRGKKQVGKKMFGREGANTAIYDATGKILREIPGEYDRYRTIYQEFAAYPQDTQGRSYQAGVFFAWEACGLGFRRGGEILDNLSKFVGHRVI